MDIKTAIKKLDTKLVKFILVSVSDTHITIPIKPPSYQTQLIDKLEEVFEKTKLDTPVFNSAGSWAQQRQGHYRQHALLSTRLHDRIKELYISYTKALEKKSKEMCLKYENTIDELKKNNKELKKKLKDNDARIYDILENQKDINKKVLENQRFMVMALARVGKSIQCRPIMKEIMDNY